MFGVLVEASQVFCPRSILNSFLFNPLVKGKVLVDFDEICLKLPVPEPPMLALSLVILAHSIAIYCFHL